jgi:hypothetical protein
MTNGMRTVTTTCNKADVIGLAAAAIMGAAVVGAVMGLAWLGRRDAVAEEKTPAPAIQWHDARPGWFTVSVPVGRKWVAVAHYEDGARTSHVGEGPATLRVAGAAMVELFGYEGRTVYRREN